MGKINIKTLKARLTLENYETIIKALGIPIFSQTKEEWRLYTGDKNKNPLDGSVKLFFYTDTKIFVSYTAARSYDIIGLVQTRLALLNNSCSFLEAVDYILNAIGMDKNIVERKTNKNTYDWEKSFGKFIRLKNGESDLPKYDINILNGLQQSYPQKWIDEGISIESMEKYHIGYYERNCQTTIPCFTKDGDLCGIRVRNWNPNLIEDGKKYMPLYLLNGEGYKFPTENIFYGMNFNWPEIERTKTCYIGESEKFVLKMDTWFGTNSTALGMFGSNLGLRRRNELLKMGVERVVYVPDNDFESFDSQEFIEWELKIKKFINLFKGYVQVEIVWNNTGDLLGYKENATDRDKETWDKLYENREIYKCEMEEKK